MNITHIIGNGFDINQGLKTSYQDFYRDYYLAQDSSAPAISKLKEAISGDIENWSDLELAIGKYTAHISSVDDLDLVMSDLQENLADYIAGIDSVQYAVDKKAADDIRRDLMFPFRHLKAREKEIFGALKANAGALNERSALQMLDQAHVISLFGVSLGETDTTWWKAVGRAVNGDPYKRLIYYHFDLKNQSNLSRQLASEARLKAHIVDIMGIQDSTKVFVKQHDGGVMFRKAFAHMPEFRNIGAVAG